MRRFIVRFLALIGGAVVLAVVVGLIGLTMLYRAKGGASVPEKTVLEINFEQEFVEYHADNSVTGVLSPQAPTLREVLDALETAAR